MSPMTFLSLPLPLALLVHLHILEYPHANNAEYDHDVFNPRKRGLRERAQTMEDVAYFLVGKVEGKNVKTILPTYPCSQPSESLAFRTSLSKYLENLRHQCIYPSSSHTRTPAKSNSSLKAADGSMAWWWKDVVVRKSLLEECSGDKFERLILSLSTHALMKTSGPLSPDKMSILLLNQPAVYTASLTRYQATRHAWTKAASSLLRSEHDLQLVRESLNVASTTKYASLSTERLQVVVESKLQSLLQRYWTGEEAKNALLYFVELAGLRLMSANSNNALLRPQTGPVEVSSIPPTVPYPLPVAAAHHPAHLKKLRRSIFQQSKRKSMAPNGTPSSLTQGLPTRSHAEIMLAPQIDSEKRVHQALLDALARTKRIGEELRMKVDELSRRAFSSGPGSDSRPATGPVSSSSLFWTPSSAFQGSSSGSDAHIKPNIDFDPKPTRELMLSLGLESEFDSLTSESGDAMTKDGQEEDALERKIQDIRGMLPRYPSLPDPGERTRHPSTTIGKDVGGLKPKAPQSAKPEVRAKLTTRVTDDPSHSNPPMRPQPRTMTNIPVPILPSPATPLISPSKSSEMRSIRRKSVRFSMAKRRSGRPSMFRAFDDGLEDEVDRLIDETHDFPTDDEDTDAESDDNVDVGSGSGVTIFRSSPFKTPKSSKKLKIRTPINRIWTAGTPTSRSRSNGQTWATPKASLFQQKMTMRQSSSSLGRLIDSEPELGLPSLESASAEEIGGVSGDQWNDEVAMEDDGGDGEWEVKDIDATPRPGRKSLPSSIKSDAEEEQGREEEDFDDEPPSMTLKDILLSADTSHFDLLELNGEDVGLGDGMLVDDTSFIWE